jgi:glycosyltransferase involved in cell wall biosynthesis
VALYFIGAKRFCVSLSKIHKKPSPMQTPLPKSVALVHDWLTGMRGGEKLLEVLCELFPDAPIYTLVAFPDKISATIRSHPIHTSFLQKFPNVERKYRNYLPLFPRAIESFDMSQYDLIVSTSHAVAKGIIPRPGALHVSYIHTPMRYVWDLFDQYFGKEIVGTTKHYLLKIIARHLRYWDIKTLPRVHAMMTNSEYVRERIKRNYGRDATVVYGPIDTKRFTVSTDDDGYYLVVSALVPYKRVDLAIDACNALGLPLRIIGSGPEKEKLQRLAGPTVRFDGWLDDAAIAEAYQRCRALIFPGEEDFGLVPIEAMACGKPVIAYGKGGATETVIEGLSGRLFPEQTVESLLKVLRAFTPADFDPQTIRKHSEQFDREIIKESVRMFIEKKWEEWNVELGITN